MQRERVQPSPGPFTGKGSGNGKGKGRAGGRPEGKGGRGAGKGKGAGSSEHSRPQSRHNPGKGRAGKCEAADASPPAAPCAASTPRATAASSGAAASSSAPLPTGQPVSTGPPAPAAKAKAAAPPAPAEAVLPGSAWDAMPQLDTPSESERRLVASLSAEERERNLERLAEERMVLEAIYGEEVRAVAEAEVEDAEQDRGPTLEVRVAPQELPSPVRLEVGAALLTTLRHATVRPPRAPPTPRRPAALARPCPVCVRPLTRFTYARVYARGTAGAADRGREQSRRALVLVAGAAAAAAAPEASAAQPVMASGPLSLSSPVGGRRRIHPPAGSRAPRRPGLSTACRLAAASAARPQVPRRRGGG